MALGVLGLGELGWLNRFGLAALLAAVMEVGIVPALRAIRELGGLALGRDAALGPIAAGAPGALGGSVSERVRETLAAMDAETRKGSATLSKADRCGTRRKSWNTVPIRRLNAGSALRGKVITSLPNMRIIPRDGRCAK